MERKIVTVLFCGIAGSTGIADRLDPEELREVMGGWFGRARAEIEAQGGTVEKYIGFLAASVAGFDQLAMTVYAATTRLDLADALIAAGRADEVPAVLDKAGVTLARVGHRPARERLEALRT
jgi:class 3 adenylate cyclase